MLLTESLQPLLSRPGVDPIRPNEDNVVAESVVVVTMDWITDGEIEDGIE